MPHPVYDHWEESPLLLCGQPALLHHPQQGVQEPLPGELLLQLLLLLHLHGEAGDEGV